MQFFNIYFAILFCHMVFYLIFKISVYFNSVSWFEFLERFVAIQRRVFDIYIQMCFLFTYDIHAAVKIYIYTHQLLCYVHLVPSELP